MPDTTGTHYIVNSKYIISCLSSDEWRREYARYKVGLDPYLGSRWVRAREIPGRYSTKVDLVRSAEDYATEKAEERSTLRKKWDDSPRYNPGGLQPKEGHINEKEIEQNERTLADWENEGGR